jgi:class 3 adenylate cyclase
MGCNITKLQRLKDQRNRDLELLRVNNHSGKSSSEPDSTGKQRTSDYIYCSSLSPVENEFRLRKTYVPNRIISRHLTNLMEEMETAKNPTINSSLRNDDKERNIDRFNMSEFLNMSNNFPWVEEYEAAVLFADISGFSQLAENLKRELKCSLNAAEDLSFYIEKCLDQMVQVIVGNGGDVIKFAGDACLAIFDAKYFQNSIAKATLGASLASLELVKLDLKAAGEKLKIHCGIGAGKIVGYHVGGVMNRFEYVVTGGAINEMSHAANESSAGEVVISKSAYQQLKLSIPKAIRRQSIHANASFQDSNLSSSTITNSFSSMGRNSSSSNNSVASSWSTKVLKKSSLGNHIADSKLNTDYSLDPIETAPLSSGNYMLVRISFPGTTPSEFYDDKLLNEETCELLLPSLNAYIPRPALSVILSGSSNRIASFQVCTTMFLKLLGLKFSNELEFLNPLQSIFTKIQEILQKYDGTVCRFIVDDKGSYVLAAFGLPPCRKRNIPKRAVLAAMEINASLSNTHKIQSQIGLTTGKVFCGTVGGAIRNEYTMHGSLVNLAARLMGKASQGILVCDHTRNLSKSDILYDSAIVLKVKGFNNPISVFHPVKAQNSLVNKNDKIESMDNYTSSNEIPIVGRDDILQFLDRRVRNFANGQKNNIVFINGGHGMGKTRLCQHLFTAAEPYSINVWLASGHEFQKKQKFEPWKKIIFQALEINDNEIEGSIFRRALWNKLQFLEGSPDFEYIYEIFPEFGFDENAIMKEKGKFMETYDNDGNANKNVLKNENDTASSLHGLAKAEKIGSIILKIFDSRNTNLDETRSYKGHTLIIFEDAHWISEVALEVLNYITSQRIQYMGVISSLIDDTVINNNYAAEINNKHFSSNGEIYPDDAMLIEESSAIYLNALGKKDVADLCKQMLDVRFIATPLVNDIVIKGQGIPLFTIEIVKMMKDQGHLVVGDDSCARLEANVVTKANESIPDIIVALVLNKLIKIESDAEKRQVERVMQVASVFGMEFKVDDLLKVKPLRTYRSSHLVENQTSNNRQVADGNNLILSNINSTENYIAAEDIDEVLHSKDRKRPNCKMKMQVLNALKHLERLCIIKKMYKPVTSNEVSPLTYKYYSFCQQYMQSVAYGTLLYDERQSIHASIASIIENEAGQSTASINITKQLAHHYFKGCIVPKALHYLEEAGYRSRIEQEYETVKLCYIRLLQMCGHYFASENFEHPILKRNSRWKVTFDTSSSIVKPWMYSNWCLHLADVYVLENNDDIALQCYYEGLYVLKRTGDVNFNPNTFFKSRFQNNRYDNKILNTLSNTEIKIASLCYLGVARLDSSLKSHETQFFYTSAIKLSQKVCSDKETSSLVSSCYVDYAWFLFCSGSKYNMAKAMPMFAKSIQLLSHVCEARILIYLHCRFGELLYASGDISTAHNYIKTAMELCNRNKYHRLQLDISLLYFYGNQLDNSFEGMYAAIKMCSRVDDHQAFFLHVYYLLEKGEFDVVANKLANHLNPKLMIKQKQCRRRSSVKEKKSSSNKSRFSSSLVLRHNGGASTLGLDRGLEHKFMRNTASSLQMSGSMMHVIDYKVLKKVIASYLNSQSAFISSPLICMSLAVFSCVKKWYQNAVDACQCCFKYLKENQRAAGPMTFYFPLATCLSIYLMIESMHKDDVLWPKRCDSYYKSMIVLLHRFKDISNHFSIIWQYVIGWQKFKMTAPMKAVKHWKSIVVENKVTSATTNFLGRMKRVISFFDSNKGSCLTYNVASIMHLYYQKGYLMRSSLEFVHDDPTEMHRSRNNYTHFVNHETRLPKNTAEFKECKS